VDINYLFVSLTTVAGLDNCLQFTNFTNTTFRQ